MVGTASLKLQNDMVNDNAATQAGGGIEIETSTGCGTPCNVQDAPIQIVDTMIRGNAATGGSGGGGSRVGRG